MLPRCHAAAMCWYDLSSDNDPVALWRLILLMVQQAQHCCQTDQEPPWVQVWVKLNTLLRYEARLSDFAPATSAGPFDGVDSADILYVFWSQSWINVDGCSRMFILSKTVLNYPWNMMFADDIVIWGESRMQVEETRRSGPRSWKRDMKVNHIRRECMN